MGSNVGLSIDQQLADRIASLPSTLGGIWEDLNTVTSMNRSGGVFDEGFTETADLTAEGTGIDAVFFGDGAQQHRWSVVSSNETPTLARRRAAPSSPRPAPSA